MKITILPLAATCGALALGIAALIAFGTEPPVWLLRAELAALSAAALLFGFARRVPSLLPWLKLRPVRGAALVCVGVVAVYLPPQLVISAVLIAAGTRLAWAEACELAAVEEEPAHGTAIIRAGASGTPATTVRGNGHAAELRRQ
jgi:hypothetical protein